MQESACGSSPPEFGCDAAVGTPALAPLVERLRIGVVVLDALGCVLGCNAAARAILASGTAVLEHEGTLEPAQPSDLEALRRLLDGACRSGRPADARGLALGRGDGQRPLELLAVPLDRHEAGAAAPAAGARPGDRGGTPAALLLLYDPDLCRRHGGDRQLRDLYRLTPAEARVVSALLDGLNVDEAAARLGLSRHTVRTHLKHVLGKTGARSQSELVRMILSGPLTLLGPQGEGFGPPAP